LAYLANRPNRPTRARLSRPGSGLGQSTDPAQPHLLTSLSPVDPSGDLDRRRRLAIPTSSGGLRRRHLERNTRPCILFNLHQLVLTAASSPRRSVAGSHSGFCISVATELDTSPASPLTPAVLLRGDLSVCVHAGGSTECGAPGGAAVRLPSAALGRPRGHCPAMPARHAPGRLVSFSFSSPPSASLTGHGL
jgi:hypothetical protein